MKKSLIAFLSIIAAECAYGADLIGWAYVNMTSDTSSNAKTMALNDARRQILTDKLSSYAMKDQLLPVLKETKNADLVPLVSAINIENEKISDTAYSAKITMTIDKTAARAWMNENDIQNWLNDGSSTDMFVAQVLLKNAIADWADFNRIMRGEKVDVMTKYISEKRVTIELPSASRAPITIALRKSGWQTSAVDGVLRVWK